MNWMERLEKVLYYRLFEMSGQAITPSQLLIVLVILITTLYAGRFVRRLCERRLLRRISIEAGVLYLLVRLTQYGVWVVGALVSLNVLNIDLTGLAVVAGGLGVGIGFGLQNVASNFVAGLILLFERPIKVDDFVTIEDIEGSVVDINSRATTIVTTDNISVIVPNSDFINRAVINWSHAQPQVRIHAAVGVAYGSDVELVTRTLMAVAAETEGVLEKPQPQVWFREFGDSALNLELLVWTDQPAKYHDLRSTLNIGIDAAFRRHNIQIPYPQRDVHIRSGESAAPEAVVPAADMGA